MSRKAIIVLAVVALGVAVWWFVFRGKGEIGYDRSKPINTGALSFLSPAQLRSLGTDVG